MVHYSKVSQITINIELYTGTTKGWVWDHFGIRIIWVIAKRLRWLEPSPHGLLSLCPYFGSSNITSKCLVSAVDFCIQSSPVGCLSTSNCAHTSPKETLPKPTLVAVHMNMQCYDHYGQTLSVYKPSNSAKYLGLRCGWAKTPDETLWLNLIVPYISTVIAKHQMPGRTAASGSRGTQRLPPHGPGTPDGGGEHRSLAISGT
jgi:hypothetical protein